MVEIFKEGFDKYGPAGTVYNITWPPNPPLLSQLTSGEWTAGGTNTNGWMAIVAGLSSPGTALLMAHLSAAGSWLTKTLPGNYTRLIGGVRFADDLNSSYTAFVGFYDVGTAQCCITINQSGTISLRTGSYSGTALATSAVSVAANSAHYLEWDISLGASGAYQVWLDGVSLFSGTGATKTTGNSYANVFRLDGYLTNLTVDDLYLFDSTGTTNNAVLLDDPVVETSFPTGDAQTQFSTNPVVLGQDYFTGTANSATNAPGANQLFLRTFTPAVNMTLNSVSCVPRASSATAKFKAVLYGAPGVAGAHRYWRLNIAASGGGTVGAAEFQFRSTVGTPLAFSGGTASASSVGGGAAANATDGNSSTFWLTTSSSSGWWSYDYGVGNSIAVAEVMIQAHPVSATYSPTSFTLQYSDDNTTWVDVANFTAAWTTPGQTQTFAVSSRPTTAGSTASVPIVTGTEVVGTTNGATLTSNFSVGQALTAGTSYAIGFIADTSVVLQLVDSTPTGIKVGNTYTNGAPSSLPTPTTSQSNWQLWGNCTGSTVNWPALDNNPPAEDASCISSATPTTEDHYTFANLSNDPTTIHSVSYKARMRRSDSGARTADIRCLSGATNNAGNNAGITPASSWGWSGTTLATDPNTGGGTGAWTGVTVNAAVAGPKVAS